MSRKNAILNLVFVWLVGILALIITWCIVGNRGSDNDGPILTSTIPDGLEYFSYVWVGLILVPLAAALTYQIVTHLPEIFKGIWSLIKILGESVKVAITG